MDSLDEVEARALLSQPHYCEDAGPFDWEVLDRPKGAFGFEQGVVATSGAGTGLFVSFHFFRSPQTRLITIKMSVFLEKRRQPRTRVYQLQITTKSYDPDNWHEEAHEHFGRGRYPVPQWRDWRSFTDVLEFFSQQTNIQFRPPLDDPEQLRLKP